MSLFKPDSTYENRVVVAMSGGVDSSVAAALLVEQGYEVVGMMMRLWSEPALGENAPVNRCCTPDQMADARRVADQLRIPFYVVDVQQHFRRTIVQFFIDEHEHGRTPNPCLECNRQIRFTYLLNQALALEAHYLATGHYARIQATPGGYILRQGIDAAKDQAYVLHMLTQEHLAHIKLPVGDYTKAEVRDLARKFNLPVASKSESQDLCFLGDGDYRRFLLEHGQRAGEPGPIVDENGRLLGQHTGLPFYTIGQRKGLGLAAPEPLFVLRKDGAQNTLVVGPREALGQWELSAHRANWISGAPPTPDQPVLVKIRYRATPVEGRVVAAEGGGGNGRFHVTFSQPVIGATPGQGVVVFDGDICLGGGIINSEQETMNDERGT
jgi:tRNA-uridine 2-sulfurtransferase